MLQHAQARERQYQSDVPAVYPLQRPTSLLGVISLAGGLAPNAGNIVTIARKKEIGKERPIVTVDALTEI